MRNRFAIGMKRSPAGRGASSPGGFAADPAHTILTVTDNAGTVIFTTAAAHGLIGDESETVNISGTTGPTYNVANTIVSSAPTTTTFGVAAITYVADATGGSWELA